MAFNTNGNAGYASFRQEDGKVLGRIRTGVKPAVPAAGEQDYRFFVEPLSPLPKGYEDARRLGFTGFMSRAGYDCSLFASDKEAWAAMEADWAQDLVLFTPALRNNKYFVIDDAQKEARPAGMGEDASFIAAPVFDAEDTAFDGDINRLCRYLVEGKPLPGLSRKYWDPNQLPPFVIAAFRAGEARKKQYVLFASLTEPAFRQAVISEGGAYFAAAGPKDLGWRLCDLAAEASRMVFCRTAPLCFLPQDLAAAMREGLAPVPEDGHLLRLLSGRKGKSQRTARAARGEAKATVKEKAAPEAQETTEPRGNAKSAAKQESKAETKAEAKQSKAETKQSKAEAKGDARGNGKGDARSDKNEVRPEAKNEPRPETKNEPRPEVKAEARPEAKGEKKSASRKTAKKARAAAESESRTQAEPPAPAPVSAPLPAAPAEVQEPDGLTEKAFLDRLSRAAKSRGLLYAESDLINFHVALKVSCLVILAGMSGTGKSGLVRLYAEAMGLPRQQAVMIPVRPSWMDDSDLLGYLDMRNMLYRPADTGLAEVLVDAARHPEKMYIVCFDEMNLARAEHYFAQFISVLEREEDPVIRLYNPALMPRIYNSEAYPAEIPVGKNVLFTGTVNVDESTYHFSDKILDRANVITLHQGKFRDLAGAGRTEPEVFPEISAGEWGAFRRSEGGVGLTEEELSFLDALNDALQAGGLAGGIGYRVARQMGRYLANIPAGLSFTRADGLDCQTVQRILTKLRGSGEQLLSLVALDEKGGLAGDAAAVLDRWSRLSSFGESRKALLRKARELKLYDYTF